MFFHVLVSCSAGPAKFELAGVRRAVVFPFDNLSGQPNDAGRRLTQTFSAGLFRSTGIEVVEQGEVDRFITEERIRGIDGLAFDVLRQMGARFNAQVIVIGGVNEFGSVQIGGESVPMVGLSIRMVNPRNGITVWSCSRSREGNDSESVFGIGKVHSIARLSEIVVDDICGQMAPAAADIARLLERKGGEIEPIAKPVEGDVVKPAAPDADEEREEVRRAVKRHWQLIEESRGR